MIAKLGNRYNKDAAGSQTSSGACSSLSRLSTNPGAPSIQIVPTLGPKVFKYDLAI